jgi:hypothetical protein
MSGRVIHLPWCQPLPTAAAENDEAPAVLPPAPSFCPCPKPARAKPSRYQLPCGRRSSWKKPINGNAVRRARRRTEDDTL